MNKWSERLRQISAAAAAARGALFSRWRSIGSAMGAKNVLVATTITLVIQALLWLASEAWHFALAWFGFDSHFLGSTSSHGLSKIVVLVFDLHLAAGVVAISVVLGYFLGETVGSMGSSMSESTD